MLVVVEGFGGLLLEGVGDGKEGIGVGIGEGVVDVVLMFLVEAFLNRE